MRMEQQAVAGAGITLTTRDHAILRGIAVHGGVGQPEYVALMAEKLGSAWIVEPGDFPTGTVRLGSRVRYSIGSGRTVEHRLVIGASAEVFGETVSLKTVYGLALIGMSGGQSRALLRADGAREAITVEAVLDGETDEPADAGCPATVESQ